MNGPYSRFGLELTTMVAENRYQQGVAEGVEQGYARLFEQLKKLEETHQVEITGLDATTSERRTLALDELVKNAIEMARKR